MKAVCVAVRRSNAAVVWLVLKRDDAIADRIKCVALIRNAVCHRSEPIKVVVSEDSCAREIGYLADLHATVPSPYYLVF